VREAGTQSCSVIQCTLNDKINVHALRRNIITGQLGTWYNEQRTVMLSSWEGNRRLLFTVKFVDSVISVNEVVFAALCLFVSLFVCLSVCLFVISLLKRF